MDVRSSSSWLTVIPTLTFAEDWLNAGALQRDADGAYLVDDIDYIRDYAKDAIKGCNPDVEGKLNANLFCF